MLIFALVLGSLASPPIDVCILLTPDDVRVLQHVSIKERKASHTIGQQMSFGQCFFEADDFVRSVTVGLISTHETRGDGRTVQAYWKDTFESAEDENPAHSIAGVGQAAFWVGDARAGSLYVLTDSVILRISVGGVDNEPERIRRSQALAWIALNRLAKGRRP